MKSCGRKKVFINKTMDERYPLMRMPFIRRMRCS